MLSPSNNPSAPSVKPPVPSLRIPLPANWREMKAREVWDLSRPLLDQLPPRDELPPEFHKLVEQAEALQAAAPNSRDSVAQCSARYGESPSILARLANLNGVVGNRDEDLSDNSRRSARRNSLWQMGKIVKRVSTGYAKAFETAIEEGTQTPL